MRNRCFRGPGNTVFDMLVYGSNSAQARPNTVRVRREYDRVRREYSASITEHGARMREYDRVWREYDASATEHGATTAQVRREHGASTTENGTSTPRASVLRQHYFVLCFFLFCPVRVGINKRLWLPIQSHGFFFVEIVWFCNLANFQLCRSLIRRGFLIFWIFQILDIPIS